MFKRIQKVNSEEDQKFGMKWKERRNRGCLVLGKKTVLILGAAHKFKKEVIFIKAEQILSHLL